MKHARKKRKYIKALFIILLCAVIGVVTNLHFKDDEEEDYSTYPTLQGQIASVGDETLLIRLDDNSDYLVSIAGVIDKNDGLLIGNKIKIYYEGDLDSSYDDIQDIKVKKYEIEQVKIGNFEDAYIDQELSQRLKNMTLEDKIAQMFLVRCPLENQTGFVEEFQPGGYILFANDFENKTTNEVKQNIQSYQNNSKINMFIAVDEEGGSVVRVSRYFRDSPFASPQEIYLEGGFEAITADTKEKDEFLKEFGINLNMAPVCDVSTNTSDFMYSRSFGKNADETATYVETVVKQMNEDKMGSCLKHFPGYGNNGDSHGDVIYDTRSYESIQENDFVPFEKGIEENGNMVLVAHNIIESVDNGSPASLSKEFHDILRDELSYDGIIITDDLVMDGVSKLDSDENNAVRAIVAGNDMLISSDASIQYEAVLNAVNNNIISVNQIDQSVLRILYYKEYLGII